MEVDVAGGVGGGDGEEGGKFTVSVASNDGTSVDGLVIVDGDAAGELDVTIGAGTSSIVDFPGSIFVGNFGAGTGNVRAVANIIAGGDISGGGTLNVTGDTASGDDAAIGRTAVEGLILTGQGSTNDITIKNDADAAVIQIPTGTVNVAMTGNVAIAANLTVAASGTFATLSVSNGATSSGAIQLFEDSDNGTDKITLTAPADLADVSTVFTLPVADGSSGQLLKTNGSGVLSFTSLAIALSDADSDTKILVEESLDEDIIRFDTGGTEQLIIKDGVIEPTTDDDINLGSSSKKFKNAYFDGAVTSDAFSGPLTGNVTAATITASTSIDITGAGGLILENDEHITNISNGVMLLTAGTTKVSADLQVTGKLVLSSAKTDSNGGSVTIDKIAGQVSFAGGTTSLVVTNNKVSTNSIIILTLASEPAAYRGISATAANGSFTIKSDAGFGGYKTYINFLIIN